jgi:DNA-binding NarL/FixJ family response regulator
MPIRVLIIDDHTIFRRGLRSILADEADITIVAEADSGPAAIALVAEHAPDVVTLDIRLGGTDGIQIARQLAQRYPEMRIIILTTYEDPQYLLGALQAGAWAYLLKNTSYETLADVIRTVQEGQRLLAPELIHHVLDDYQRLVQHQIRHTSGLSEQDLEILRLLAEGASSREVADRLYWSEITAKRKIQDIVEKLAATNRVHAVAEAMRRGLI